MRSRVVVQRKAVSQLLFSVRRVKGVEWTAAVGGEGSVKCDAITFK